MQALRSEILPPSGTQFVTSLKLIPYTVCRRRAQCVDLSEQSALCNLVVAQSNILRIYEIVEETGLVGQPSSSRKWAESDVVEGEVGMDAQGEGFVNMGTVKVHPVPISHFFCKHHTNLSARFGCL